MRSTVRRYRRLWRIRARDWLVENSYEGVMNERHWMGVQALKHPLDAWVYQEIIYETKPQVIVELGSRFGGSTLFLAHLLDLIGEGRVVSVDIDRGDFAVAHPRIDMVTGDTHSPEVIAAVQSHCEGRKTMLIHDASHHGEDVLDDLRNYSPLVSPGCYLLVEDGLGDVMGKLRPGPLWAIERFLEETDGFTVDESRERHLLTYNPQGFLKRHQE